MTLLHALLALIWVIAMIAYSFAQDYSLTFPEQKRPWLSMVRWGALLVAMGLSGYLAIIYTEKLSGTGVWVFMLVVLVIITLAKIAFRQLVKYQKLGQHKLGKHRSEKHSSGKQGLGKK